ncbi:MAG: insulinase family protein [Clostridia bacterium]|nr:insulinase family protein [Clostridia bacterium]
MKNELFSSLLKESYTVTEHPSGLRIYVFPKKMSSIYSLFAVRYGSLDNRFYGADGEEITVPDGVAHFLEHKLFDSPDGTDVFSEFSAIGADANAYTSYNRTAYLFSCTERVREALEILIKFVTTPYFTEASVKKEQGIIAEEIKMYEDSPWERVYQNMLGLLYPTHPVSRNICGSVASIKKITPELLYRCYGAFYRLSNMALVVCGDVDENEILETADRLLPKTVQASPRRILDRDCAPLGQRRISARMQVAKPIFSIGIKDTVLLQDPAKRLKRDFIMAVLNEMLFSQSGELYGELFEQGLITPSFSFGYSSMETFAFNCITGEASDPEVVMERVLAYLERVKKEGLSKDSFERCRRALYADEIRAYDSTEEIANRLLSFAFEGGEMFDAPKILESVTLAEAEELLHSFYREENVGMSVILPLEEIETDKRKDNTV